MARLGAAGLGVARQGQGTRKWVLGDREAAALREEGTTADLAQGLLKRIPMLPKLELYELFDGAILAVAIVAFVWFCLGCPTIQF